MQLPIHLKRRGSTLAGIFCAALMSVLLLCGAGNTPTGNLATSDINANGHNLTNAATVSATNVIVTGSLTAPASFTLPATSLTGTLPYSHLSGTPSLYGTNGTTSISGTGTTTLTASGPVNSNVTTIGAGSGTYSAALVLSHSGASTGQLYEISVSIPASTNPTLGIYDNSTSGTLLATVNSNGMAGTTTLSFFYNGTTWVKFPKGALLTYQNLADLTNPAVAFANIVKVPVNSAVIVLGESYTFYPIVGAGTNGQQSATGGTGGMTWPQWLSSFPAFHNIPVVNYGVSGSTCVGASRVLAGTTSGSGYQNDYFYAGTEYMNGAVVGTVASITALPSTWVPSASSGGIAYFINTNDGINELVQGISSSTFATQMLANFATERGYGSNVKIYGMCGSQQTLKSLDQQILYTNFIRSNLNSISGLTTGYDGYVDLASVFLDDADLLYFQSDNIHLTSLGYGYVAMMFQGQILGIPYTPNLTNNRNVLDSTANTFAKTQTFNGAFVSAAGAKVTTSGTSNVDMFDCLAASLAAGSLDYLTVGRATTTGNCAGLSFNYSSAGSNSNYWALNTFANKPVAGFGTGDLVVGETTPADDGNALQVTGNIEAISGSVIAATVGNGVKIKEGTNCKQGVATLASGTATVSDTAVTSGSRIQLSGGALNASTALGVLDVSSQTVGTGFTITSYVPGGTTTQTGDLRTVTYEIFEAAP